MKIGIIGAGGIGQAFARQALRAGYEVIISNSRGPDSLAELVQGLGRNITAGTVAEAAAAEIVLLALPWQEVQKVTAQVASWEGKIVIDPTNPVLPGFVLDDLRGKTSSEILEEWVPGARLVKSFNTLTPGILGASPREGNGSRVMFFSGNDEYARKIVGGIITRIGFAGIDLGRLQEGGRLMQFPGGPLPTLNLLKL